MDAIKSAMSGFHLPPANVPKWAEHLNEKEWKDKLMERINSKQSPTAVKNRDKRRQVGKMAAAMIGIVQENDIAGPDIAEALLDGQCGPRQCADMHRDVVGLCNQTALCVANG